MTTSDGHTTVRSPELEVRCRVRLGETNLDIDWQARPQMTAVIGRSGVGKTVLLSMLAGLVRPDEGVVRWAGRTFDDTNAGVHVPPHRRRLGYVFQHSRLFPHLTVTENLAYSRRTDRRSQAFADVVRDLGLEPLLDRRPGALSGGERQRVALGRSVLSRPELLLLDEPVSALDLSTRLRFMGYLARLREHFDTPMLFVSHDSDLVGQFASDAALMVDGRVVQSGPTRTVLSSAAGGMSTPNANLFAGRVEANDESGSLIALDGRTVRVASIGLEPKTRVWLRILASDLLLMIEQPVGISARNVFEGSVNRLDRQGDRVAVWVQAGPEWVVDILPTTVDALALEPGRQLYLVAKATSFQVFRAD